MKMYEPAMWHLIKIGKYLNETKFNVDEIFEMIKNQNEY